jgi:hypothetical protein
VLTSATQVLLVHRCGLEVPHPSLPRSERWKWKLTDDGDARDCVGQGSRALGHAVATVSMSREDMKLHALGQQQWEAFHARHASVQGTSAIERELDIDCSTVRNCRSQPWPAGHHLRWRKPLLERSVGASPAVEVVLAMNRSKQWRWSCLVTRHLTAAS